MRVACVDLPAFPLQLVRRRHPEWRGHSIVVIDKDSPRGVVLWANERARRGGILPGMRYAAGLSLDSDLRATLVAATEIDTAIEELAALFRRYTPSVEPSAQEPGLFWLDAEGLSLLYPSLQAWAKALTTALSEVHLVAGIAVGHSRYGSYATARALAGRGHKVWATPDDERLAADRVPLHRIDLVPKAREALAQLGVHTLGQLTQLPEAGLVRRFGKQVQLLHQLAKGTRQEPLTPSLAEEPLSLRIDFDDPIADREALLFFAKQLLDPLLATLAARSQALCELALTLYVDTGVDGRGGGSSAPVVEHLRPATPTLDGLLLLGLVRLRLELGAITAGVRGLSLEVKGQLASREQLALFLSTIEKPKRDLAAGARALARLRAALGDDAVVKAQLCEGHLPEASYGFIPIDRLVSAQPHRVPLRPLVRRIHARPLALPPRPAREPDGWLLLGIPAGPVTRLSGPFCISGGWWNKEIRRDYYFAELERGDLCWIFYDRPRRRWYLHGQA